MTEANPVPETVKQCLEGVKGRRVKPDLRRAPAEQVDRLWSLCDQMLARVKAEPDTNRFADIRDLADEAAELAMRLGFVCPPIQPIHYQRGQNHAADPLPAWGWPYYPLYWRMIRQLRQEYVHIWGYRLHDPLNPAKFCEFNCVAEAERQGKAGAQTIDPWANQSKFVYRARASEFLGKWLRVLQTRKRSGRRTKSKPAPAGRV